MAGLDIIEEELTCRAFRTLLLRLPTDEDDVAVRGGALDDGEELRPIDVAVTEVPVGRDACVWPT